MGFAKTIKPVMGTSFTEGRQFAAFAQHHGVSIAHLARELGLHPQTVRDYIAGRRRISRTVLLALEAVDTEYGKRES